MAAFSYPEIVHSGLFEALAVLVIFAALLALGRWLKRRCAVRLGVAYQLFALTVALYSPVRYLPALAQWRPELSRHLEAVALLSGVFCLLAMVRRFFWEGWFTRTQRTSAPKFLSELIGLLIFLVAVLAVFGGIYGQSIQGAVFGSTIVIGIVGFAMQDLLGNIIAGIALELGKPFRVGDWLVVDGRHAEVMEVNWRSTRLRNNDDVYLDLPNKAIVGSTIINLTFPARAHAVRIQVSLEYSVPPNLVKDVLSRAAAEVQGVLPQPAPSVRLLQFGDSAAVYEVKFFLEDEARYNEILDGIRTNIWYAAQRAGLHFPPPSRTVHLERTPLRRHEAVSLAYPSVSRHPFLQLLEEAQLSKLLTQARLQRFGRGERIIEQGAPGGSMFIFLHGEAEVLLRTRGLETAIATLVAGDYCGEMSLLTGEPRSATVRARTDCELWEVDKATMSELLHENENLVQRLSQILAERQLATEGVVASHANRIDVLHKQQEYAEGFLRKVCSFFNL